jgi:hypothetical protein
MGAETPKDLRREFIHYNTYTKAMVSSRPLAALVLYGKCDPGRSNVCVRRSDAADRSFGRELLGQRGQRPLH